jgi:hypothetical protein
MNIDLKHYKGFALMKNDLLSRESQVISMMCNTWDIPLARVDKNKPCPKEYIPCGSVEWCELSMGYNILGVESNFHIQPNYYPMWLNEYLYRNVWETDKWPLGKKVFIKPSDRYKRFTGFCTTGTHKKKKKPPFICSDIVTFENEWRYYISNGKVLCGQWYWGNEVNTPDAPNIDHIKFPEGFCGAVDFGMMKVNESIPYKFALIEVQHPFACGWYGKQHELYLQWLIDGWEYMEEL